MPSDRRIAVIGLGYVGLPVAVAFARADCPVIGFDIDAGRVEELRAGHDRTREVDAAGLRNPHLTLTTDRAALRKADFFIVTVPTPIDARPPARPYGALLGASETVGRALKQGDIVVYEFHRLSGRDRRRSASRCWREASGLVAGRDFTVGYSPERINPGDQQHRFETITKVVVRPGCAHARHRRGRLRLGGHGRHPPGVRRSRSPKPPRSSRTPSATSTSR